MKTVNIKNLERMLVAAKYEQYPELYTITQEDVNATSVEGYTRDSDAIDIVNLLLHNTCLTKRDLLKLISELRLYEK